MRKIVLGVTGSIAAYKTLEIVRKLKKCGEEVVCVFTLEATKFVTELSFSTLSNNPVVTDFFKFEEQPVHVNLAASDVVLVAPCTYNFIGKIAAGIADDPLSCIIAATNSPVIFAPCMDTGMWENPILQENINKLRNLGYHFIEPDVGELASLKIGKGRFPEPDFIIEKVYEILKPRGELRNKKIVITAGRTEEYIDAVRCITNRSSGRMGYALASEAQLRGGQVTLISGPSSLDPPAGVEFVRVKTTMELEREVLARLSGADVLIMAAAVANYTPKEYFEKKLKDSQIVIQFKRTADILKLARRRYRKLFIVGFSLEAENHVRRAKEKLKDKTLDVIISNDVVSLDSLETKVTLIDKSFKIKRLPLLSKSEAAKQIMDYLVEKVNSKGCSK